MTDARLVRPSWRGRTNVDAFTIAWIEHAEAIIRERWPQLAHQFVVTQGSYQGGAGDPNSGDTHALGGPVDLRWCGHPECLLALRLAGGFVWLRTPAQGPWPHHIHGAPIGHPYMDPSAQRQETAYLGRRNGLKNNGPDDGPQLDPIPRPVWPYPPEEDMPLTDQDIDRIAKAVLAAEIADDGRTVKKALRQASKAPTLVDQVADRVAALLDARTSLDGVIVELPADELKAAVKQALREGTDD